MKLRSLSVNQFKKFTAPMRLKDIEDGLNVIVGPNEMGKSTLLDALRAVLFEKYSSKAKPIFALQNDRNRAAPVVRLEFELDDGLYRVTKRFLKKPYAQLSCPDGRSLESDTAEDKLRELLDFHEPSKTGAKPETLGMWSVLWVQQGQSFRVIDLPESARSSLHTALESEVGTVLGGHRGRALPLAIEKQLSELVTSTTKKPRGAYKQLIDLAGRTREDLDELRARRRDLTQTLNDLEDAQENLKRLTSGVHDQPDQKEIDRARQRHSQCAQLEARIEGAITELELKRLSLAQTQQAAVDRKQLKVDIKGEETSLQQAEERLAEAREQEHEDRSKLNKLRANVREWEEAVTRAEDSFSRHRRVLGTVEREARLREFEERHDKAEAAEGRQRKAQEAAAAMLVTDSALKTIREGSQEAESVRIRLGAAATVITFDINRNDIFGIDVDGKPLTADHLSIQAVEPVTITIPNRGKILVEPAIKDRDQLLRQRRDAATMLQEALEGAGAKSLADAEAQYAERQMLLRDAEIARQAAELHAPASRDCKAGAQALGIYIKGLRQVLKREMVELAVCELPTLDDAETALQTAQRQADEIRIRLRTERATLSGQEERLGALQAEIGTFQGRHDESKERLDKLRDQVARAEKNLSSIELKAAVEEAHAALAEQESNIADLKAERTDETLPQLTARIDRLETALRDRRDRRANLKERIAGLKSRIEAAEGAGLDEAIEQKACDLELIEEEKIRQDREVQILSLLLSTLRSAEQEAKEQYLSPVLTRVQPYLQLLFPGANVRIDENLHISAVVREAGYEEAFNHLSVGTKEQIAVLIRLAFAEMLVEQGHPATIVLDDALVFSDDRRMRRIFDILNMAARHVQIIVFTCREQVFEGLGGRQLVLEPEHGEELASA